MKSLEYRLEKTPELKNFYQDSIKVDVEKGFIRILKPEELEATKIERQWYITHHPVEKPNKPDKVRRVCNAASKFRGISLNDNLLTGPDLLQTLIGIMIVKCCNFFGETIQMNPLRCFSIEGISSEQKVRQIALIMLCNKFQEITHMSPHKLQT